MDSDNSRPPQQQQQQRPGANRPPLDDPYYGEGADFLVQPPVKQYEADAAAAKLLQTSQESEQQQQQPAQGRGLPTWEQAQQMPLPRRQVDLPGDVDPEEVREELERHRKQYPERNG